MPIDILKDKLIPIHDLGGKFPMPSGKPRSVKSILKWVAVGLKCTHRGDFIKLEAKRVGGTWFTTEDAVHDFTEETTRKSLGVSTPGPRSQSKRQSAANRRAREKLKDRGLCK